MGLPRIDEHAVPRPRLLSRFTDLAPVTLVMGPIGSGKTAVVAQWAAAARHEGRTVLWLDGSVDQPRTIVDALARTAGLSPDPSTDPEAGPAEALTKATAALRVLHDELIVVIDDFDPVAEELGAPLLALLRRSRRLHVVLCLRDRPDFVHEALAIPGCRLISSDELALTCEEIVEQAADRGVVVSEESAEEILRLTRGSPLLVQVGLPAEACGDAWSLERVRALVTGMVERELDPRQIAIASAIAHLPDPDLPTLRAALGPDHEQLLAPWCEAGVIEQVPGHTQRALCLPPVVAQVLRDLHDPGHDDLVDAVHENVIAELERTGEVLEALALARRTGLHDALWGVVRRHWWDIAAADMSVLAGALAAIPEEVLPPGSILVQHLNLLIPDREAPELPTPLETLPSSAEELREAAGDEDAATVLDGITISLLAARFAGDRPGALDHVRRGTVMTAVMRREHAHALPSGVRRFFVQAGLVHLLEGDLVAAERAFLRAYGPDKQRTPDVLRRETANKLALVHALRGDHHRTRVWVERAVEIDPPTGWLAPMIESPRRLALALLALDRLDHDAVERQLAGLSASIATDELWFLGLSVGAEASMLWSDQHEILHDIQLERASRSALVGPGTLARAQLVTWETSLLIGLGHGTAAEQVASEADDSLQVAVARARVMTLSGRGHEALAVLARVTQTPHEQLRHRVQALVLTAQIYRDLGRDDAAVAHLVRAAQHPHLLATFAAAPRSLLADHLEAVPALAPILRKLDRHGIGPTFPETLDVIALTSRESELLELLTTPQARDTIARRLFVSANTVKTQLRTLYRKLGVTSREEAVARAYELGLLH